MIVHIFSRNYPTPLNPVSAIFVRDQAEALASEGHDVSVFCAVSVSLLQFLKKPSLCFRSYCGKKNGVSSYVRTFVAPPKMHSMMAWIRMHVLVSLHRKYSYTPPDVIHCHFVDSAEAGILEKCRSGACLVITEHGSNFAIGNLPRYLRRSAERLYPKADGLIAVSQQLGNILEKCYKKKFITIPNCVDVANFTSGVINDDLYRFISVGNLTANKNHTMLIDAFFEAFKGDQKVSLTIIGSGEEEAYLHNKVKKLGLLSVVKFTGRLERTSVARELVDASAFVHPSIYETFGVALIEALCVGLPVVTTKSGGPEEIIDSNEIGIICETTKSDLAKALVDCRNRRWDRSRISEIAKSRYSPSVIARKITDVYLMALASNEQQLIK